MGYSTIAFNHVVTSRLDPNLHRNPFHRNDDEGVDADDGRARASTSASAATAASAATLMPSASRAAYPHLATLRQLQRLTLILDAASEGKNGLASGIGPGASQACLLTYDLLAVRPTTLNTFNNVCLNHTELKPTGPSFDIISLDLASSPRLPFPLKRSTIGKALENGAVFEVCYSDALPYPHGAASSAAPHETRLRNLISNTRDLLRVTNGGKGLILSSSASNVLGLRSPTDVMNLAVVFGWSPQLARDAMTQTARAVWKRAETRRSFRGVVGMPRVVSDGQEEATTAPPAATAAAAAPLPAAVDPPAPQPSLDPRTRPHPGTHAHAHALDAHARARTDASSNKRPSDQPNAKAAKKQKKK